MAQSCMTEWHLGARSRVCVRSQMFIMQVAGDICTLPMTTFLYLDIFGSCLGSAFTELLNVFGQMVR